LTAAVVCLLAATVVALGVLWRTEVSHAHRLTDSLQLTQGRLASTQAKLARTRSQLAATSSESERRRRALVETQDVLAQVDPLLSAVDGVQGKASDLGRQGSTIAADSESFITTVSDLVNYMLQTDQAYIDYSYVSQQIDTANGELASIRADEAAFSDSSSAYGATSSAFTTKASAFTQSVRTLQKQLKGAVRQ
jgi:hypothetical protein